MMLVVSLIVLQIIIFVALIFVFRRIMTQNVSTATSHLAHLNEEYTRKEEEAETRLAEAQQKAEELIQEAQAQAQGAKDAIIKSAEEEKNTIIEQARAQAEEIVRQADKSRTQILAEIEQRIEKQAITKACELIQDSLPDDFKKGVHMRWVSDLLEGGFETLQHLKLPEKVTEVTVLSAFELSQGDAEKITGKLQERIGKRFTVKPQTDPALVAGIMIKIGSLVLDGSLRHKIQERAR